MKLNIYLLARTFSYWGYIVVRGQHCLVVEDGRNQINLHKYKPHAWLITGLHFVTGPISWPQLWHHVGLLLAWMSYFFTHGVGTKTYVLDSNQRYITLTLANISYLLKVSHKNKYSTYSVYLRQCQSLFVHIVCWCIWLWTCIPMHWLRHVHILSTCFIIWSRLYNTHNNMVII